MKKKFYLSLLLVPLLVLTSCDELGEESAPEAPSFTLEEVGEILDEFDSSSINEYTYWYRYYNGEWSDEAEVTSLKIYEQGYDGEKTVYSDLPSISSLTSDNYSTGRYASYILDDDYYITGLEGVSDDYDYVQYNERNMYIDYGTTEDLEVVYTNLYYAFVDTSYLWADYYFDVSDVTSSYNDDGNVEVSISAYAPEDEYYGAEESAAILEIDPEDYSVISMTFYVIVYELGDVTGIVDEGASYYQYYKVENLTYGAVYTEDIEPFDFANFSDDQILNTPAQVVENLEDGTLSEDSIKQILGNYEAYLEGVISSTDKSYINEFYHPDYDYMDVGATEVTITKNAYEGYILESSTIYTPSNTDYDAYTYEVKYEATEEGVLTTDAYGSYLTEGKYVTSMDYYFLASPFTSDYSVTEAFDFVAEFGVGEDGDKEEGFYQEVTSISGTKNGDNITIEFHYNASYAGIYDYSYDYEIYIEDNFMNSVTKVEQNENTSSFYTLEKGTLPTYSSQQFLLI